jgi:hypothetical protein
MARTSMRALVLAALCATVAPAGLAQDKQPPLSQIPDPGVPELVRMEGPYVRAAYNDEGYVVLGYRAANNSVGGPWMLLDAGIALGKGRKNQKITRDEVSLSTPDGKTIPLPSNAEYVSANLTALEYRASMFLDRELTFPDGAYLRRCPDKDGSRFFYDSAATLYARVYPPLDGVTLNPQCRWEGTLYFPVPGGIQYGQYFLNVTFDGSRIRVPFRIMTTDEEKTLNDNYERIKKQFEEAFPPKRK